MSALSPTLLASIVTILAIIVYMIAGGRVGSMRGKHNISAPAVTGHPEFERAYRVQMNTLEAMPVFLPGLWLASMYFSGSVQSVWWLPALLGAFWIIGRIMYMQAYMADPAKRGTGFGISAISQIGLLLLAVVGIIMSWHAPATV